MLERRHPFAYFITIAIILGFAFWFAGGKQVKDLAPYYFDRLLGHTASVRINNLDIKAEVARSERARTKGLSGRDTLESGHGMVFVFPQAGDYAFTMAKTKIPLDIIWINDNAIVYIAASAAPGQPIIDPNVEADTVLEVGGNVASGGGWQVGDSVSVTFEPSFFHF
jgi:uncharacterized membrane protein (UPF0127 family)